MMHKAWSSIEEVPYCFSRSSVKFQGHTAKKIVEFDPNWVFPDCNSSLNSPIAMKCCTKLETAKERCPIVFQGHPSNFKVTRDKTSPILTQIGLFRTIGGSQLSNPWDLPCFKITNHNQHAFNIKYLANLIKKYWTCFCYQKLADCLVCFLPSVRVQVRWPPSWKICLRIQLSFGFWAVQSRPSTTFPESWHDYWKQYFRSFGRGICLPNSPKWRYWQNYDASLLWIQTSYRFDWYLTYKISTRPRLCTLLIKWTPDWDHQNIKYIFRFVATWPK